MFSSMQERPAKRRIHEIDQKIKCISRVVNSMTGPEKSYLERKLLTVELKKHKMQALSAFAEAQKMNGMLAEIDMLDTENDVNLEIESIRNSKRFKKSEMSMLSKECEDIASCTTPNPSPSTSTNETSDATPQHQETSEDEIYGNTYMTKRELVDYYNKAMDDATTKLKEKIDAEHQLRCTENVTTKENDKNLVESTPNQTINAVHDETKNVTLQTEIKVTSSKTKKEHKKKSKKSKKDKHVKVSLESKIIEPKTYLTDDDNEPSNSCITDQEISQQAAPIEMQADCSHTHDNIINLYRSYKKIISPDSQSVVAISECSDSNFCINNEATQMVNTSETIVDLSVKKIEEKHAKNLNVLHKKIVSDESTKLTISKTITDSLNKPFSVTASSKSKHSMKRKHKPDKEYKTSNKTMRVTKTDKKTYSPMKTMTNQSTEMIRSHAIQHFNSQEIVDSQQTNVVGTYDEKSIHHMNVLVKQAMDRNVQNVPDEDGINDLFKDIMANKHINIELDSSSGKTIICFQCGEVKEGHMCAYTIKELLEQC